MFYNTFLGLVIGFIGGLVLSSFFEHAIHKYFLHSTPRALRKSIYIKSMWKGHAISHHGSYAPDEHYTQDDTNKAEVLTFSWFEGPLIILAATAFVYGIAAVISLLIGTQLSSIFPEVIGAGLAFTLYYISYESLHAIMHVPSKWRWLYKTSVMVWLNRHHYQHHLDPRTNLNVIIPIADYVWGTKRLLPKEHYVYAEPILCIIDNE